MKRNAFMFGLVVIAAANLCSAQENTHHRDDMDQLQPPEKIMDAISLKPGMVIGEVGAGGSLPHQGEFHNLVAGE